MKLFSTAVVFATLVTVGQSQAQVVAAPRPGSASVSGVIFDSVTHSPLSSALVQLVNADSLSASARTVESDSLGRFNFGDIRPGRYLLGFMHPMLDSLGIEPKPREVRVGGETAVRSDLAIPSALTLRRTICGASAVADSEALIIGIVRRATDRVAVDSSVVSAQ